MKAGRGRRGGHTHVTMRVPRVGQRTGWIVGCLLSLGNDTCSNGVHFLSENQLRTDVYLIMIHWVWEQLERLEGSLCQETV